MLNLTTFKKDLFRWFPLLAKNATYIDISHGTKVYRLHVEDLQQTVKQKRKPKSLKKEVTTGKCTACRGLLINGVCMGVDCPLQQFSSRGDNERTPDNEQ
jgi:hypothetical protein